MRRAMSDEVLLQLVSKAAGEAGDAALQVSTPLATFCTVGLISRVYDIIAKREPGITQRSSSCTSSAPRAGDRI